MVDFPPVNFVLVTVLTLVGAVTTGYGIFQRSATRLSRRARRRWERTLLSWGVFAPSNEPSPEVVEELAVDLTRGDARFAICIGGGVLVGGIVAGAILFSIRDTSLAQSSFAEWLLLAVMALGLLVGTIVALLGTGMRVLSRAESRNRHWWPLALIAPIVLMYSAVTLAVSLGLVAGASPDRSTGLDTLDLRASQWVLWVLPVAAALVLAASELTIYLMNRRAYPIRSVDAAVARLAAERSLDGRIRVFAHFECFFPSLILVQQTEVLGLDFSSLLTLGFALLPLVGMIAGFFVFMRTPTRSANQQSAPS